MARRKLIAGNWKMNGLRADGTGAGGGRGEAAEGGRPGPLRHAGLPAVHADPAVARCRGRHRRRRRRPGLPHAGRRARIPATSAPAMLKDLGCSYVIVGHSERRTNHGETDAIVKAKAEAAPSPPASSPSSASARPSKSAMPARPSRSTAASCSARCRKAPPQPIRSIAYEPVWAIGTGRTATPEQAQEVHAMIRAELRGKARPGDGRRPCASSTAAR